jgi:hypothetical protein
MEKEMEGLCSKRRSKFLERVEEEGAVEEEVDKN